MPEALWVGVEEGTGSSLAQVQLIRTPEFDSCAVSHFCSLLPCATVTMAALSFPDWLCDHNGYFWVSTSLMELAVLCHSEGTAGHKGSHGVKMLSILSLYLI